MCLKVTSKRLTAEEDIVVYKYLYKIKSSIPEKVKNIIGKKFFAKIRDEGVTGRLQIEYGHLYLCQNIYNGRECGNKLGFDYSWLCDRDVTNLQIEGIEDSDDIFNTTYKTPFQSFPVIIGNTYESCLVLEYREINEGLHSFVHKEDCIICSKPYNVVVKCIIPKGASYYKGTFSQGFLERENYVSDKITYVEIIK